MASRLARKGKVEPNIARIGPNMDPRGFHNYLGSPGRCPSPLFRPILGPFWAILVPPWPFCGGPGGHLEADLGLGRLDLGVVRLEVAQDGHQEGSRNYLARFIRSVAHLFGPILGLSGAILGPPWPFSGGLGGHLEADLGLGRLDLGV